LHTLNGLLGRPAGTGPSVTMQKELAGWQRQLTSTEDPEALWSAVKQFNAAAPSLHSRIPWAKMAAGSHKPYAVYLLSPLQKLMQTDLPDMQSQVRGELFAARDEAQSLQVIVAAPAGPLHHVVVTADLTGPGGHPIVPELHRVGYVNVRHPTPGGTGLPGRYPDPLFPLAPFDVTAAQTQSVWLTAWVPRDATPGKYHGQVTITPEGMPSVRLKLNLTVFHATLPVQSRLKTDVGIWGTARDVYGKAWNQQRADHFTETGLRYRFTSPPSLPWDKVWGHGSDGAVTADWSAFDPAVMSWMAKGATAFSIDTIMDWSMDPPAPAAQPEATGRFRLLGQHLHDRGWDDRFYFYRFDEPGADAIPRLQRLCDYVHAAAPNIKILLTGFHPGFQQFAGRIGIWVPHINQFDPAFMDERRAAGDEIWMYVCIATVGTTYPDVWRIDWTGTAHRAIGHWLWRNQCSGFLYWCVDYWTQGLHKGFDLLDEPMAFPGGNGDGFLFYPDPAGGDPLPSIRVELMRDGFQDYDLLQLLQDKTMQVQSNPQSAQRFAPWLKRANALLHTTAIIPTPSDFSKDPGVYDRFHREVLEGLDD
nr:DUF4091 domain-containing protein [Armatimonadota bacterium]